MIPVGGAGLEIQVTMGLSSAFSQITYHPSSPLKAIAERALNVQVTYDPGTDPKAAARPGAPFADGDGSSYQSRRRGRV